MKKIFFLILMLIFLSGSSVEAANVTYSCSSLIDVSGCTANAEIPQENVGSNVAMERAREQCRTWCGAVQNNVQPASSIKNKNSLSNQPQTDEGFGDLSSGEIQLPQNTGLPPGPSGGIAEILTNFLNWLLYISGVIAILSFVISGLKYMYAFGEKAEAEKAKKMVGYSILGVLAVLSGLILVRAIEAFLTPGSII